MTWNGGWASFFNDRRSERLREKASRASKKIIINKQREKEAEAELKEAYDNTGRTEGKVD